MSATTEVKAGNSRRTILVLLPLVLFVGLAVLFYFRLWAGDVSRIPSALIGQQAPKTDLPPLAGLERNGQQIPGLNSADFIGQVTLVNVWASWCIPCADEVQYLDRLAKDKRFRLVGLNYKDAPDNARRFLNRYGNPFIASGTDQSGRASIDWGVYGVPENFVIGKDGRIAYKLVGPVTAENIDTVLRPEIEKALNP